MGEHIDQLDDSYVDGKVRDDEEFDLISFLGVCATWFIRIGLVIGAILLVYYVVVGNIFSALLFILGMVIAYFFGYFFMFCLDKIMSSN